LYFSNKSRIFSQISSLRRPTHGSRTAKEHNRMWSVSVLGHSLVVRRTSSRQLQVTLPSSLTAVQPNSVLSDPSQSEITRQYRPSLPASTLHRPESTASSTPFFAQLIAGAGLPSTRTSRRAVWPCSTLAFLGLRINSGGLRRLQPLEQSDEVTDVRKSGFTRRRLGGAGRPPSVDFLATLLAQLSWSE